MFKLRKSESGLAHMMIPMVVIVLVAVGGVGYYVYNKNKDSGSSAKLTSAQAASSKAVSDACNTTLKDKDFCKFASNFSAVESYKVTISSTTDGKSTVISSEIENSKNTSSITKIDDKEVSAYVSLGNDNYIKDESDGAWTKSTSPEDVSSTGTPNFKDSVKTDDFSPAEVAKTQYKKISKEACGNLTCFKYQITQTENPNTQNFIWFDTQDYLMRRMTYVVNDETTEMKLSYDKVKISAPTPVKESSGTPTQAQIDAAMKATEASTYTDPSDPSDQ